MLTNKELLERLNSLGLSSDEAKLYLELLKEPSTHLRLSRITGVDRAKIYRVAEQLEKRSLLMRMTDDRGTFLVAADPTTLELELVSREQKLQRQRNILQTLLPPLSALQALSVSPEFSVKTYEGQAGLKQMCWNELKTRGEIIVFGHGNIETLTSDRHWTLKHRQRQVSNRYHNRDLVNEDNTTRDKLAHEKLYEAHLYRARVLPSDILRFGNDSQTVIYNDTVEIFHWQEDQRVGIEIVNLSYANMMRQLFEHYWQIAQELTLSQQVAKR